MTPHPPTVVVLMGVSGAGKTTVGLAAAARAGVTFLDADALHPEANVAKMAAGTPLDDSDRAPWLDAVAAALVAEAPCILACSALRAAYRDRLRVDAPLARFVLLDLDRAALERRLAAREGHFMPAALLDSQLATLEPPAAHEGVLVLDAERSVDELAAAVAALLVPRVD
ncbi:gluconokinase [Microcella humidisoli]|uniref:Gluconokinase n=1 Tax=Microcella humidisoli TaxID=2963406 RepID=A0ABY5FXB4_9MICO|nr:gluconokinase [Microcella humidisoli]UTT62948.1 gluconokinase [Microcella humidisoli]